MSNLITFEIKGLKEMGDQLARFPGKIARKELGAAVSEAARVIRDASRGKAPLGTKTYKDKKGRIHRPGLLRKTNRAGGITSRRLRSRNWWNTALFGVGFSKRGFYGKWIEYGKDKKHHYDPHPFIVPAFEANVGAAIDAFKKRLGEDLEILIRETPGMSVSGPAGSTVRSGHRYLTQGRGPR